MLPVVLFRTHATDALVFRIHLQYSFGKEDDWDILMYPILAQKWMDIIWQICWRTKWRRTVYWTGGKDGYMHPRTTRRQLFHPEQCATMSDVLIMVNHRLELYVGSLVQCLIWWCTQVCVISCCHLLGPDLAIFLLRCQYVYQITCTACSELFSSRTAW